MVRLGPTEEVGQIAAEFGGHGPLVFGFVDVRDLNVLGARENGRPASPFAGRFSWCDFSFSVFMNACVQ